MMSLFQNRDYAHLFSAQVIALLGTGLLTVALGLLAYDLAGANAGAVLGTAYAIKMLAYVGLSPIAGAIVERLPRKPVLIAMDLIRASIALCLPFVDAIWQIYVLIFILQSASATFTPTFQAVLPDILPKERDYTRALSLSRLAYDLENLLSPTLAGLLLLVISYNWLFLGTVLGFLLSSVLVARALFPHRTTISDRPFLQRVTHGTRLYLATPRLRGLLMLYVAVAATSAFVLVNTIIMVRTTYGLNEAALALAMACFGAGSMAAALTLPRVLETMADRGIMIGAAIALSILTATHGIWTLVAGPLPWIGFLVLWGLSGALLATIQTPSGRLIRRSASDLDLTALFTAQFALSHACWLFAYPVAGWSGARFGPAYSMMLLGGVGLVAALLAGFVWPARAKKPRAKGSTDIAK